MRKSAYEIRGYNKVTGEDKGVAIPTTFPKVTAQRYATIMNRTERKFYPHSPIKFKAVKY